MLRTLFLISSITFCCMKHHKLHFRLIEITARTSHVSMRHSEGCFSDASHGMVTCSMARPLTKFFFCSFMKSKLVRNNPIVHLGAEAAHFHSRGDPIEHCTMINSFSSYQDGKVCGKSCWVFQGDYFSNVNQVILDSIKLSIF